MPLSDDDVREILRLIDESDVEELRVETEAFSLYVLRGKASTPDQPSADATGPPQEIPSDKVSLGEDARGEPTGADHVTISAPMLGTFYRAEAPGAAPYVEVGTGVEPDTVVCLIEVMKMMNADPAGIAGTIVEICAENAQLVEYDAPLFRVEPRE
jgi:acetyl-CoA carboxylase biotin carboxyl carrier protein